MSELIAGEDYFNSIDPGSKNTIVHSSPASKELYQPGNEWSSDLVRYLILTYGRERIPELSPEALFTSRYYYLKKFYHSYKTIHGEDAGMIQQIGGLVEEMSNALTNYDWAILAKISKELGEE